jgi:imidazolonepropionase-like amidohydrolase
MLSIRARFAWLGPGRLVPDVQVDCEAGLVSYVGRVRPVPDDADLIVSDGFLMPAAADRHVHIGLGDPVAMVQRGVTAVRDLAWPADRIFGLAETSEAPGFNGPLIRAAGPMLTGPGGYPTTASWAPPGTGREVSTADDGAAAVAELVGLGATAIKVSLNIVEGPTPSDATLAAICDAARGAGVPVTAHAEGEGQVERALGAGIDELAHTPWTHRLGDDTIAMAAGRMRWVSTLAIHGNGADTPELRTALDNLRRFHAAGGTVAYGTDLGNGPVPSGIHTLELRLLREAGLDADAMLEAFARAPIEPGAPADLIVADDSPIGDPEALDDLRLVVRAGRVVVRRP